MPIAVCTWASILVCHRLFVEKDPLHLTLINFMAKIRYYKSKVISSSTGNEIVTVKLTFWVSFWSGHLWVLFHIKSPWNVFNFSHFRIYGINLGVTREANIYGFVVLVV